jgi:hypothetical protein
MQGIARAVVPTDIARAAGSLATVPIERGTRAGAKPAHCPSPSSPNGSAEASGPLLHHLPVPAGRPRLERRRVRAVRWD